MRWRQELAAEMVASSACDLRQEELKSDFQKRLPERGLAVVLDEAV
jgi:hypothetical protein